MNKKWLFLIIFIAIFFSNSLFAHAQEGGDLITEKIFPVSDTGEAIGVKVMENSRWLTPKQWYKNFAPNPKNNPSYITVDNFLAIEDGRTVYVGAVDVKDQNTNNPKIYPRIYLISYSKDAGEETKQIYDYLLENWEFNTNMDNDVYKNQLKKDILRIYDIEQIKSLLETYRSVKNTYPILTSGTYIKGQTTSKWPSWQNTLGQELGGVNLPVDPINEFNDNCGNCGEDNCDGTCYNSLTKEFFHNKGSHIYKYVVPVQDDCRGEYYVLSANLEYKPEDVDKVTWVGEKSIDVTLGDKDVNSNFYYNSDSAPVCGNNNIECGEVCDGNAITRPNAYCNEDTSCQGWNCNNLYGDCDNNLARDGSNGCETYLGDDIENCGQCNNVCEAPDNARSICEDGECDWECNDGFRRYDNVCEYDHCISPDGAVGSTREIDCSNEVQNGSGVKTTECQNLHPPQWSTGDNCVITDCDEGFEEENGECVTELNVPETPTNLSASINNDNLVSKINLEWDDNADNENGFSLERKQGAGSWGEIQPNLSADLESFVDDSLSPNTTYYYRIRSYNGDGYSGYSNDTSFTTYECDPTIPETNSEDCSDDISNGSGEKTRVCQVDGTWDNWGVCEVTSCNEGFIEEENSCIIEIPVKPDNISGNAISSTEINLTWSDNSDNEDEFVVERDGTILDTSLTENTTEYNDTGLDSDTTYSYRVRACIDDNCSDWSDGIDITTLEAELNVPSQPSNLEANSLSSSEISLSWTDNSDNEDEFVIYQNDNELTRPTANSTNYNSDGLNPDTTYTYKIKACNNDGCSSLSSEVSATTSSSDQGSAPNVPDNLSGEALSSTEVRLTWSDNSDNEDEFVVERDGTVLDTSLTENTTEYNDTGLGPDTEYVYKVKACNGDLCSDWSDFIQIYTDEEQLNIPSQPTNLEANVLSNSEISLSWSDNSDNEDEFVVYQNDNELTRPTANSTSYNSDGLNPDTTYTYKIKACNNDGCSDLSSEVSATTMSDEDPNTFGINDKPTNITLENSTQSEICFSWDDNSDINEGYIIETKCETNSWIETHKSSDSNMINWCQDSLPAGITFHFRVKAWKGESDYTQYSDELTATTNNTICCLSTLWPESWCSFGCSCGSWDLE